MGTICAMYVFGNELTVDGDLDRLWAVWSDLPRFPEWDPRELVTRINGPFAVGTTVYSKQQGNPGGESTITVVEPPHRWTAESPLPGGMLVIEHRLEPTEDGRVTVSKRYEVRGPLTLLFRVYYGPRVRTAMVGTFRALAEEAARRS